MTPSATKPTPSTASAHTGSRLNSGKSIMHTPSICRMPNQMSMSLGKFRTLTMKNVTYEITRAAPNTYTPR